MLEPRAGEWHELLGDRAVAVRELVLVEARLDEGARDQRARRLGVARHALTEHARDLERVLVVEAGLAVARAELGRLEVLLAVDAIVRSRDREAERAPARGQELELDARPFGDLARRVARLRAERPRHGREHELVVGDGSLNLTTGSDNDKAVFGNEIDEVAGGLLADVEQVGFHVFTTQENSKRGNNMPSIIFEINPNRGDRPAKTYSSLVFMPNNSANGWSGFIDATKAASGKWGLTGWGEPTTTCNINGSRCTWDEIQAYLNDDGEAATIKSVSISKGRDCAFSGAVDGLRVNDTVFDFESDGVFTTTV